MNEIRDAILSDSLDALTGLAVPESYRGVVVLKEEQDIFEGMPTREKDPHKSLHVQEVPTPELGPGEAIVAVMASSVNYNTVWTSIFEPVSTFGFLERYGRLHELARRHDLPYHVVGSDLAGVVLRVGPGVNRWKPGMRWWRTACRWSWRTRDGAGRAGRLRRPPQPAPGQGRRPHPRPHRGPRRPQPRQARPPPRRDQPLQGPLVTSDELQRIGYRGRAHGIANRRTADLRRCWVSSGRGHGRSTEPRPPRRPRAAPSRQIAD